VNRRRLAGISLLFPVILAFVAVKLVAGGPDEFTGHNSDAPFGPFAGYTWIGGVGSVAASFAVPRIAAGSSSGQAGTWIGAQGSGPPSRFIQVGAIESRVTKPRALDRYYAFWSDTARRYRPKILFLVSAGDELSASLTLAHKHWTLAIADTTSRRRAHFSTPENAAGVFDQAEWTQENPGSEKHHLPYPQMMAATLRNVTVNGAAPPPATLYSSWMSLNHTTLAPTQLRAGSFTLAQAPKPGAAARQYLRLTAVPGTTGEQFQEERAKWTVDTPYAKIANSSSSYIRATRAGSRALLDARWSPDVRPLVASVAHATDGALEQARPPSDLTAASLAAWNARLTNAAKHVLAAGAKLRLALGLPGFGPAYRR
jgi:hypothetical protein